MRALIKHISVLAKMTPVHFFEATALKVEVFGLLFSLVLIRLQGADRGFFGRNHSKLVS
jgi:hypothetical protein